MASYKELIVWQKSVELTVVIYKITGTFPKHELFSLTSQIRRSSIAIPSNIAEGQKRGHSSEFIQFLRISYSSGAELETQVLIANKIGYLTSGQYKKISLLLEEIMKMLNKLISKLSSQNSKNYKL